MQTSMHGEFSELAEMYLLDTVGVSSGLVHSWLSSTSRFQQRRVRWYTSRSDDVNNRPSEFSGNPTTVNSEAREWQSKKGTLVFAPDPFWGRLFREHRPSPTAADYDNRGAHQNIPCVFLEHALKNSGFGSI